MLKLMVDNRERPPTGVVELALKKDPSTRCKLVGNFDLNINTTYKGEKITLSISSKEMPPLGPFEPKLTDMQLGGLWLITEGSVFPEVDGMPVWKIADLLQKRISNVSRDIIKPFEEWDLTCHVPRKSTRKGTSNPNQPEKAYYIKRIGLRNVFNILFPSFTKHYFNNLTWAPRKPEEVTYDNFIADKRFITLALLQKMLKEYESSRQYYDDLVGKFSDHCEVRPIYANPEKDE
jgi:hypothetical protein